MSETKTEVLALFNGKGLVPYILKIGGKKYNIREVNLVHTISDGLVRIYFFSVSDEVNFWKLGFNTETLTWWVEEEYSK